MLATKRLSNRAVGFIISGAKENSDINAKYPLAPPCPTLAYKKAIIVPDGHV